MRGQYYSLAAAICQLGASVFGTFVLQIIQSGVPNPVRVEQDPIPVFGALCVFSGFLNLFLNPDIGQEGRIRLLCNVEGQYCQKERKERKRENGLANTSILSDI